MHALIIEDDYLIGRDIEDALTGLGFTSFSFARSQDAAVAAAATERPDLITADLRLLPGDGVDAVKSIRAERKIPVIFITGFAEDVLERVPNALVVQKPIKPLELNDAVEQAMGRRRATDPD